MDDSPTHGCAARHLCSVLPSMAAETFVRRRLAASMGADYRRRRWARRILSGDQAWRPGPIAECQTFTAGPFANPGHAMDETGSWPGRGHRDRTDNREIP